MKKKFFVISSILILATVALCCLFALPQEAKAATSDYYTYYVFGGEATITDCNIAISGDVVIPDTLGGYPVTSIGSSAFGDCTRLTSITISDSVTSIGDWAFSYCTGLTSVTIPDSVTSIGDFAFADCTGLTSVKIPDSVTSIGDYAFSRCASLTNVIIPYSVKTIGACVFNSCTNLSRIVVDTDNPAYCNDEFGVLYNKNKTTLLQAPGDISGTYVIPNSVKDIADSAFEDCHRLSGVIIQNGVASIGEEAFADCSSLISISIPDSVTNIGIWAFGQCENLTSVSIGRGVTHIGYCTFAFCSSLASVTISDSITNIVREAFGDCTDLTTIYYAGSQEKWSKISIGVYNDSLECATIHYLHSHNYSTLVPKIVAPTCLAQGYTAYTCFCGAAYVDSQIDALGHSFTNYKSNNNATCIADGTETAKCDRCDELHTRTEKGSATGHNYNTVVTAPTCLEQGYTTHTCHCDDTFVDSYVDALDHSFTNYQSNNDATCTEDGTETAKCDRCDETHTRTEKGSAPGHSYNTVVTAPTCLEQGYTTHTCHCGDTFVDNYVDALDHSFTNYQSNNDATCTVDGTETAKCDRCNEVDTRTEEGSAKGHSYDTGKVTKAATCKAAGVKTYTCKVCKATKTSAIAKLTTHTYKTTTTKATLSKNGSIVKKCTVCSKVASTTTISYPKTFKLSATSYAYDGTAKTPTVTVKDAAGKTLKKGTDYTVTYASGRKAIGTYKVTIKMAGNYSGTKTLTFKINVASVSTCTFKLAATSYTYDGKTKAPTVTVKNAAGMTLKKNTDYTVTYASGRKNVGTYKVTIKMKGNYTGTKTLTFKIIPKAASINKLTAKSKAIAVKLNRVTSQSTGYEIQYSTAKDFKGAKTTAVKSYKTSSVTLSKLKAKTTYYVRVRTYKTVNGTKIYSNWSTAKSIKTK